MQLSLHADYSLRTLIYLGCRPGEPSRTADIAAAYGISRHHLVRVVQQLAELGYLEVRAGRNGGVLLARPPHEVRLGAVVRETEPNLRLVECFDRETNTCPIAPACALRQALREGLTAMLEALDRYTLADVLDARQPRLRELLQIQGP